MLKTDDPNLAAANAALEKRAALFEQLKAVHEDSALTVEVKAERTQRINAEIASLGAEADRRIRAAEIEVESRELIGRAAALAAGGGQGGKRTEWRNGLLPTAGEWRALLDTTTTGEAAVPTKVAARYRELLVARSSFLRAPGLSIEPFTGGAFIVPQSNGGVGTAGVVGEGKTIPVTELILSPLEFRPVKYSERVRATFEFIQDSSVNVENLVASTLIKRVAAAVDSDAFQGAGATATPDPEMLGITNAANSTAVNLATGKKQVTHDNLIAEYAAILAAGGEPTVIWASMDQWPGLVAERAAADGHYLNGAAGADPARAAWGVPILPAPNLAARQVILADAREIMVGLRQDVRLSRSDDVEFNEDITNWKVGYRIAGVKSNDRSAVRLIVAAAS
ncbi:phage major capsid protein [Micromonospora aurantiaca (nom. illeg.)]|uniref:phage major capsid protein n=1 Tax=Micromonospora aurantiaca (nom. illeg.) TaxID=47850 RepID=UPI003EBAF2DA